MLDLTILVRADSVPRARVKIGSIVLRKLSQKYGRFPDKIESKIGMPVIEFIVPGEAKQRAHCVASDPEP